MCYLCWWKYICQCCRNISRKGGKNWKVNFACIRSIIHTMGKMEVIHKSKFKKKKINNFVKNEDCPKSKWEVQPEITTTFYQIKWHVKFQIKWNVNVKIKKCLISLKTFTGSNTIIKFSIATIHRNSKISKEIKTNVIETLIPGVIPSSYILARIFFCRISCWSNQLCGSGPPHLLIKTL